MKNGKIVGIVIAGVILLLGAGLFFLRTPDVQDDVDPQVEEEVDAVKPKKNPSRKTTTSRVRADAESGTADAEPSDDPDETGMDPEPEMTEEEKKEAEEEKRVDEFDAAVDKWMELTEKAVTMDDVDKFRDMFRLVPKARKEECIQRALNLIPDDNVMLLAGILLDKEQDKEILDLIYNDILNRDEEVKKPILQEIFKDKDHPNWADTAWILDATGELPKSKE